MNGVAALSPSLKYQEFTVGFARLTKQLLGNGPTTNVNCGRLTISDTETTVVVVVSVFVVVVGVTVMVSVATVG